MPDPLQIRAKDGCIWTVNEILQSGSVRISRPRTELERFYEKTPGDRWVFVSPLHFYFLFGCTPTDVLQGWL